MIKRNRKRKKKTKIRRRSVIAKDLRSPKYRSKVVPDKKRRTKGSITVEDLLDVLDRGNHGD